MGNNDPAAFVSVEDAMPYFGAVCLVRRMVDGEVRDELAVHMPLDVDAATQKLVDVMDAPWLWRGKRRSGRGVTHWRPLTRWLEELLSTRGPTGEIL